MSLEFCRKCRAIVEADELFCSRCLTPVRRGSLLGQALQGIANWCGRLFRGSGARRLSHEFDDGPTASMNITLRRSERITVHDETTGEVREYSSLDDLPAEMRETIETMVRSAKTGGATRGTVGMTEQSITKRTVTRPGGSHHREITVRDSDGIEQRYDSIDQVPRELRRMLENLPDPSSDRNEGDGRRRRSGR